MHTLVGLMAGGVVFCAAAVHMRVCAEAVVVFALAVLVVAIGVRPAIRILRMDFVGRRWRRVILDR
jgi:hypothetical protein